MNKVLYISSAASFRVEGLDTTICLRGESHNLFVDESDNSFYMRCASDTDFLSSIINEENKELIHKAMNNHYIRHYHRAAIANKILSIPSPENDIILFKRNGLKLARQRYSNSATFYREGVLSVGRSLYIIEDKKMYYKHPTKENSVTINTMSLAEYINLNFNSISDIGSLLHELNLNHILEGSYEAEILDSMLSSERIGKYLKNSLHKKPWVSIVTRDIISKHYSPKKDE